MMASSRKGYLLENAGQSLNSSSAEISFNLLPTHTGKLQANWKAITLNATLPGKTAKGTPKY